MTSYLPRSVLDRSEKLGFSAETEPMLRDFQRQIQAGLTQLNDAAASVLPSLGEPAVSPTPARPEPMPTLPAPEPFRLPEPDPLAAAEPPSEPPPDAGMMPAGAMPQNATDPAPFALPSFESLVAPLRAAAPTAPSDIPGPDLGPGGTPVRTGAEMDAGVPARGGGMPANPPGSFAIDRSSMPAFLGSFRGAAEQALEARGYPTSLAPILAAIPVNEQGWQREAPGNNYFGIKGSNPRTGANTGPVATWEDYGGGRVNIQDTFRAYGSPAESVADFIQFLEDNPRYAGAVKIARETGDPAQFIRAVHAAGYATDPQWSDKVLRIARQVPAAPISTTQAASEARSGERTLAGITPEQFGLGDADAESICGPVLMMAFARSNGRNPTIAEAKQVAARNGGWTSAQGMGGPAATAQALRAMGVPATYREGPLDIETIRRETANGNPVGLNTRGHYFVVEGVDADGRLNLGNSAGALRASQGRRWFRPDEIASLGTGAPTGAIYKDAPSSPTPSVAVRETGMRPVTPNAGAAPLPVPQPAPAPAASPPQPVAGAPARDDWRRGTPAEAPTTALDAARASAGGGDVMLRGPLDEQPADAPIDGGAGPPLPPVRDDYRTAPTPAPVDPDLGPREAIPGSVGANPYLGPLSPNPEPVTPAAPVAPPHQVTRYVPSYAPQAAQVTPEQAPSASPMETAIRPALETLDAANEWVINSPLGNLMPQAWGRELAGADQMAAEFGEDHARLAALIDRWRNGDQSVKAEMDALSASLNRRMQTERPYRETMLEAGTRNPNKTAETLGALSGAAVTTALAPSLGAGVVRNVAAAAMDPVGQGLGVALEAPFRVAEAAAPAIRGALDANAQRVAAADARAAETGSTSAAASFGMTPGRAAPEEFGGPASVPIGSISPNATVGPVPSAGPERLAQINADIGSSLGSSTFGAAAGAALPAETEEERAQNALRGAGLGLIGGPLASRAMRRVGGALATPGVSPQPSRRASALPEGGRPIRLTPEQEAVRLRLDKFPEPLRPAIQQAAEATGFAHEARRGVIPDAAAEGLADDVGRTVDEWIARSRAGRAYTTEETRALRNVVTGQAQKVDDLARQIAEADDAGTVTDLLVVQAHREGEKLAGLVSVMEGARAEAGRTLRAWIADPRPTSPNEAAQRIFNKFGGGPEGRARAIDALKEFSRIPVDDPIARAQFWARVERGGKITTSDVLTAIRYNSMLSSPRTWEIGWVGSALQVPVKVGSDVMAAASRPTSGELGEAARGAVVGMRAGLRPLWETIQHGITSEAAMAGQLPRGLAARATSPAGKALGTLIDIPGRMVAAPDALFSSLFRGMETGRQAAIAAHRAGLKGDERARFIQDFAANTPKAAEAEITRVVDDLMLRGDMGRLGQWAVGGLSRDPLIASFVAPFMRIAYHSWTQGLDLTPVGALGTLADVVRGAYKDGPPTGVRPLAERARHNAIGVGITGAAVMQAMQGNISGAGPDDPEKRDQLRAQGWQPYSIRLGDTWVSYANWGPVSVPLAGAAAYAENQQYKKTDAKPEDQMFDLAKRTAQLVTEQSFLQGIGTIMNAFEDPQRYLPQFLTGQAASFIPYGSMLNTIGQAQDPVQRRPDRASDVGVLANLAQSVEGRIPINPWTPDRSDVPPAQDPLGRTVPNQQQGPAAFQPFRFSGDRPDPVLQAFTDAKVDISRPSNEVTEDGVKIELTPDETRRWNTLRGEEISRQVQRLSDIGTLGRLTPTRRAERLTEIRMEAAERATERLKREIGYPQWTQRRRQARQAQGG